MPSIKCRFFASQGLQGGLYNEFELFLFTEFLVVCDDDPKPCASPIPSGRPRRRRLDPKTACVSAWPSAMSFTGRPPGRPGRHPGGRPTGWKRWSPEEIVIYPVDATSACPYVFRTWFFPRTFEMTSLCTMLWATKELIYIMNVDYLGQACFESIL